MTTADMFDGSPEPSNTTTPLPTTTAAFELGVEAATERFGLDCNPWVIRERSTADVRKAWDEGWHSFLAIGDHATLADAGDTASGLMAGEKQPSGIHDEVNTSAWDANCWNCESPCEYSTSAQYCHACSEEQKVRDNAVHIPEFTLKGMKYAAFASQDSDCFEATLYADGKRFATAHDDGHGGEIDFAPVTGSNKIIYDPRCHKSNTLYALLKDINAALLIRDGFETHDRQDGSTFTLANNKVEYIVSHLVGEYLVTKELKKKLKNRVVYYTSDNKLMETSKAKNAATLKAWIQNSHADEGIVLNTLDFDEALKLYRKAT